MTVQTWARDGYTISTDPARLDLVTAHGFIAGSYWAKGIPFDTFVRSVQGALCFGVYQGEALVGFARVISDCATVAYLGDVFIAESHCGQGLARWLMDCITGHPDLQGLRRWMLLTGDAHGLYRKFGFTDLAAPSRWMERAVPDIYQKPSR